MHMLPHLVPKADQLSYSHLRRNSAANTW